MADCYIEPCSLQSESTYTPEKFAGGHSTVDPAIYNNLWAILSDSSAQRTAKQRATLFPTCTKFNN